MGDLVAVAGGQHAIGGVLTYGAVDFVEADFASQVWVNVDGWETRGDLGDSAGEINTPIINRGRNVKQKGTFDAGSMENSFAYVPGDLGQLAVIAASKTRYEYAFRNQFGDTPIVKTSSVTITVAAPGVVTWANHGLPDGTKVVFTTTGTLPTGITASTTYYVVNAASGTFQIAATKGGTAITTTGSAGTGHTATTQPTPTTEYFTGKVMGAPIAGGDANSILMLSETIAVCSNVVLVPALG